MSHIIELNVDRKQYESKPQGSVAQERLKWPVRIDFEELIDVLCHGGNCRAGAVRGKKNTDFISAQTIFIDIDNGRKVKGVFVPAQNPLTPEKAIAIIEKCGFHVNALYFTWSDQGESAEYRKFRMVLLLDKPIYNPNRFEAAVTYMLNQLPAECVDYGTTNPARVFYGGCKKPLMVDTTDINSTDEILEKSKDVVIKKYRPRQKPCRVDAPEQEGREGNGYVPEDAQEANGRVVDAIRNHDSQYLKRRIGNRKTVFDSQKDLYNYIYYKINIAQLLGVTPNTAFRCVFPDHPDEHPSASCFRSSTGVWIYKCFVDGNYNLKQFVEELGNFKSEYAALQFICEIYNLSVRKTKWSEEQAQNIDRILQMITSAEGEDAFCTICPTAAKVTRSAMRTYIQILIQAKATLYPEKCGNGDIIFYLSTRRIANAIGAKSPTQVQSHIKQLIYCQMLSVLADEDIPPAIYKKAVENAKDGRKRTAVYSVPSFVVQRTKLIEEYGKKWRKNGYTLRGVSFEMFYRCEPEEARRLYPDSKMRKLENGKIVPRTTSTAADDLRDEIAAFIVSEIDDHGYCVERKIVDFAKNKYRVELQVAKSLTEICQSNNLRKCRLNKGLKEFYNISGNGYPNIIIRDE